MLFYLDIILTKKKNSFKEKLFGKVQIVARGSRNK